MTLLVLLHMVVAMNLLVVVMLVLLVLVVGCRCCGCSRSRRGGGRVQLVQVVLLFEVRQVQVMMQWAATRVREVRHFAWLGGWRWVGMMLLLVVYCCCVVISTARLVPSGEADCFCLYLADGGAAKS